MGEYQNMKTAYKLFKKSTQGGPVVKNPPSNAGDAGSIPGWGTKVPYATGQLGPCSATTEAACHS